MSSVTTNFQFTLPAINNAIDANIWGGQLNGNNTNLDGYLLGVDTGNIGSTAPTIPATAAATAGMVWINNTSGAGGVWPVQIYDGTNWVTTGMLDTTNHIYSNVGNLAVNVQPFLTAGSYTYTPSVGMSYCIVEICGGGGGGGAVTSGNPGAAASGGGGGGQYTRQIFTIAQIGANKAIVIGAGGAAGLSGGTSTFGTSTGSLSVAGGSGAATGVGNRNALSIFAGGAGGTSTGFLGFLTANGTQGGVGYTQFTGGLLAYGGFGGCSSFGGGGQGYYTTTSGQQGSGLTSSAPGAGGGGSASLFVAGGGAGGAAGSPGAVIVTEYI